MSFYPAAQFDPITRVTVPYRRRVGHEVELSRGGKTFMRLGAERGFLPPIPQEDPNRYRYSWEESDDFARGLHGYRCRCRQAQRYPIHPTYDATASSGEHIIGGRSGVLFASTAYMKAIAALAELCRDAPAYGSGGTGGHTHVSTKGLTMANALTLFRNLEVVWAELRVLAQGPWDELRSNGCMSAPLTGKLTNIWTNDHELVSVWDARPSEVWKLEAANSAFRYSKTAGSRKPRKTVEFRIWNTSTSKWRLYLAGGVSSALVEAAVQGRALPQGSKQTIVEHLDGLLTPDLVALVERQKAILRGDMSFAA